MKQISKFMFLSILIVMVAIFCSLPNKSSHSNNSQSVSMNESLKLTDEELSALKKDALMGSADAGYELMEYYAVYARNKKLARYWAQIAAENGSANNAFNYATYLYEDETNMESLIRAHFWAKRSIELGGNHHKFLERIAIRIKKLQTKRSD